VASYLTLDEWRTRSVMPPGDVERLEDVRPGFVAARLSMRSAELNARLAKRYAVSFGAPAPELVCLWLTVIVTLDAYEALGFPPGTDTARIVDAAKAAQDAAKEAADGQAGLYDLPLRANTDASGVERGGPLGYSEPGPYDWMDRQREEVRR
jgi:hypothetical protein